MKKRVSVFVLVFLYVGLPLLFYALRYKLVAPLYLFAGDSFYYLDIARRSLGHSGFTFDGQFPTNGFHPLWEYVLLGLGKARIVDYSSNVQPLLPVYLVNALTLALGAATFCAAATRYLRRPLMAMLMAAPGLFWILTASVAASHFSTWSYANGMESALALLCFSLAFALCGEDEAGVGKTFAIAVMLGLAVLARLDDVFLAACVGGWLVLRSSPQGRLRRVLALSPIAVLVGWYVVYNRLHVGVFLPTSGAVKAGFALPVNIMWTVRMFLPLLTGDKPQALAQHQPFFSFGEATGRVLQMVLPAVICLVELRWRRRQRSEGAAFSLVDALCVGVILKAAYNFVFVEAFAQGQWYYTVSIAAANLVLVLWVERAVEKLWPVVGLTRRGELRFLGVQLLWMLFALNVVLSWRNFTGGSAELRLLNDNSAFRAKLQSLGADRIFEFDDGFTSYVADVPAEAGIGLALDPQAVKALKENRLLDLSYKRGYRIAVSRGGYVDIIDAALASNRAGVPRAVLAVQPPEFKQYQLVPLGGDGSDDGLWFYRIVPVTGS